MQSPWTRDDKVRAVLVSITPQVSGLIEQLGVEDNQFVHKGERLFMLDGERFRIAVLNAEAKPAQSDLIKAEHVARRRQNLPRKVISAEDLESATPQKKRKADRPGLNDVVAIGRCDITNPEWSSA